MTAIRNYKRYGLLAVLLIRFDSSRQSRTAWIIAIHTPIGPNSSMNGFVERPFPNRSLGPPLADALSEWARIINNSET